MHTSRDIRRWQVKRTPLKRKPMKRSRKKAVPKEIKDHWTRIAGLGCFVTFDPEPTIHHCHGGSVRDRWGDKAMPGTGQRANHWLTIPLAARLHTGINGIDTDGQGVRDWETRFGRQTDMLDRLRSICKARWGYDIYEKAGLL